MKKQIWFVSALLVLAVVLGACGSAADAQPAGSTGTQGEQSGLNAQSIPPIYSGNNPGLTVSGVGRVEADPDIAHLTAGVELAGTDAAAVVDEAGQRMERILSAVRAQGVAEEDIHTASYNLRVGQEHDPQTGRPTGEMEYTVFHTVRITVREIDAVGALLAEVVNAGANVVHEVSFSVEDTDALVAEARRLAVVDAQEKAQQLADALGVSLGRVSSVSESGGSYPVRVDRAAFEVPEAAAAVPMPAGSFSVSVSVVVVYELP